MRAASTGFSSRDRGHSSSCTFWIILTAWVVSSPKDADPGQDLWMPREGVRFAMGAVTLAKTVSCSVFAV